MKKLDMKTFLEWMKPFDNDDLQTGFVGGYNIIVDQDYDEEYDRDEANQNLEITQTIIFVDYKTTFTFTGYREYSYDQWVDTNWDDKPNEFYN